MKLLRFIVSMVVSTALGTAFGSLIPVPVLGNALGGALGGYVIGHYLGVHDAMRDKKLWKEMGIDHVGGDERKTRFGWGFVLMLIAILGVMGVYLFRGF